jgi:hypothetical protein
MSKRALVRATPPARARAAALTLARNGLANLQARMVRAAVERRDLSDLELQQDTVEAARRLTTALREAQRNAPTQAARDELVGAWVQARAYHQQAEAVLARLEARGALEAARPRRLGTGQ